MNNQELIVYRDAETNKWVPYATVYNDEQAIRYQADLFAHHAIIGERVTQGAFARRRNEEELV